ncbi:sensor histidine kinase [Streptomyces rishiriensis]|uniref:Signal transduction histidine kinase n=1 Tax=Streptomyces rishiriensis TaxID=68264 RepID=A0ABU0NJI6_STRRH|nr:sensor histidine kinase [Streptomyces rishiriensis]MDQ0579273.1 signal transduction histidine kinase [Streptomyces rishiriensis]
MRHTDPDERRLGTVVHLAFFALLGSSFVRFLSRDRGEAHTGWVVALYAAFCLLYVLGPFLAAAPRPGSAPTSRHLAWLGSVSAVWVILLALAPSATWCAMPLLFAGLHALPPRIAVPLAAVLTALVVVSEVRVADGALNPNMVVAPPAVAAVATAVLVHLQRQGARQRVLIDDLVRTRRELAASERQAGVLAERQRLSTEIHDTLAQGLSSQRMLLHAAQRVWKSDPEAAREHVREAAEISSRGLAEARRFVHDLAPADLAAHSLPEALTVLAARESGPGLTVEFRLEGAPGRLPERVEAALLRIAQGALANVREHAAATRGVLTLTCLDDLVSLDVADNGRGFGPAPGAAARPPATADPFAPHTAPAVVPGAAPNALRHTASHTAPAFLPHIAPDAPPDPLSDAPPDPLPGTASAVDPGTVRMPEQDRTRGHGIRAMRIRARQAGGTLSVESAPGEGTVVTVAVPLASSVPDPLEEPVP